MLTITGLIAKALATQSPKLVVLARITDQDSNDFYFTSGAHRPDLTTYLDYVQGLHSVTPISPQIDPITRKSQSSMVTVTFVDDGVIREIMQTQPLKQATMTLRLTTADDTSGSSIGLWKGIIHDVVPQPGFIEFQCMDALSIAFGAYYYGLLMNRHPLEWVDDLAEAAGVPSAFRDSTSLDPDTDTAISHFCVNCRWTPTETDQSTEANVAGDVMPPQTDYTTYDATQNREDVMFSPAVEIGEAIADMALLLYGTILADEDGKIGFKRFDPSGAVAATWTSEDILSLRQLSTYDNLINEVQVELGSGVIKEAYIRRDTDSQARYKTAGATQRDYVLKLNLSYACQEIWFVGDIDSSQTTGIILGHTRLSGMCGTRVTAGSFRNQAAATAWGDVSPFIVPAAAQLSDSRKLYIKADGEILTTTAIGFTINNYWDIPDIDRRGAALTTHSFFPTRALIIGAVRGVGGTGQAHTQGAAASPYYDITIAHYVAAAIIDRAANGIPELEVETTFAQYGVQVGDLVDPVDDYPLWWGVDGVNSVNQIKWEVIAKEADPLGSGRIRWRLAYAAIATPPWTTTVEDDPVDPEYQPDASGAPRVDITLTADQSITAKAWALIEFDTIEWQQGQGLGITTHDYVCPASGAYSISGRARILSLDAGAYVQLGIYINGTGTVFGLRFYNDSASPRNTDCDIYVSPQYVGVGETVDLRIYHSGAGVLNVSGYPDYTRFQIALVAAQGSGA